MVAARRNDRSDGRGNARRWCQTISIAVVCLWAAVPGSHAWSGDLVGRASCGASTCHGGVIGRGPAWRSALSRWAAEDPHAGAGIVLRGDLSESIVSALDPAIAEKRESEAGLATEDQTWRHDRDRLLRSRCLSCHVTTTAEETRTDELLSAAELSVGVSCESCHGGASDWLDRHYVEGFAGPGHDGLLDTETILGRGSRCVRCHVGTRTDDGEMTRDVNHDLIAAGHPVLRFELELYDKSLPRHWDPANSAEFYQSPVRTRRAGRALTFAASARLSAERADHFSQGNLAVPMPEFADFDCFGCHQSLGMDQYRLPSDEPQSKLRISAGLPIWNSWHTVGQQEFREDHLSKLAPRFVDGDRAKELSRIGLGIAGIFEKRARDSAAAEFDAATELKRVLAQLRKKSDAGHLPIHDWHEAAIVYLDIDAALREMARRDPDAAKVRDQLMGDVQSSLAFERGTNSPFRFDVDASRKYSRRIVEIVSPLLR